MNSPRDFVLLSTAMRTLLFFLALAFVVPFIGRPQSSPATRPASETVTVRGIAVREADASPVANATLVVRTADNSVDFPETWTKIGGRSDAKSLESFPALRAKLMQAGGWRAAHSALTRADGKFEIQVPRNCTFFVIDAEAEGWRSTEQRRHSLEDSDLGDGIVVLLNPAIRAQGRVLDPDGKPVAGAWVENAHFDAWGERYYESMPVGRVTNAKGEFTFPALASMHEVTEIVIYKDPFVPLKLTSGNLSGNIWNVEARMQPGFPIRVILKNSDGTTARDPNLVVERPGVEDYEPFGSEHLVAADGSILFPAIPAGSYDLSAIIDGHRVKLNKTPVIIPIPNGKTDLNFTLPTDDSTESGKVKSSNSATPRSSRMILHVMDGATSRPVTKFDYFLLNSPPLSTGLPNFYLLNLDGKNTLEIDGAPMMGESLAEHNWFIHIRAAGYQEYRDNLSVKEGGIGELTISLDRACSVRGRVVDASTGRPIAAAEIRYRTLPVNSYGEGVRETISLADGTFHLGGFGKKIQILVAANGYCEAHSNTIDLAPGERRDLGIIKIGKGGSIRGTVKDKSGNPVRSGSVAAEIKTDLKSPDFPMVYSRAATIEQDGTFQLDLLFPGAWQLKATAAESVSTFGPPGWAGPTSQSVRVTVEAGETQTVILQLADAPGKNSADK